MAPFRRHFWPCGHGESQRALRPDFSIEGTVLNCFRDVLTGDWIHKLPPHTELVRREGGPVGLLGNTTGPYRDPKTAKRII